MNYHVATLGLISKPVARGSEEKVAQAEQRLGFALPGSVREWYTAVDGQGLLSKYSNEDQAFAPSEFTPVTVCGRRLVKFLVENQGVCWWGFELTGSDDPPVYMDLDAPADRLFPYAATFSEFTYLRVFDFDGWWAEDRFVLETRAPLTAAARRWLDETVRAEPRSEGWPGTVVLRYTSPFGRIVIWESKEQADWILSCPSAAALAQLKAQVSSVW